MKALPLISIIIPVFNRENIVGDTLRSIINQTFTSWECIVIDDNSTDNTISELKMYQEIDSRIKVIKRPNNIKKGANSCRNYGFKQTKASYIKWFDSDDLMLTNHLEISIEKLISSDVDFVVTDSINFDHKTGGILNKPFGFNRKDAIINSENLAFNKIGWITDDFLGRRELLEDLSFNENITDGDEYNFFIKLLHHTKKGIFLNEIVTLRRIHDNSISVINRKSNFDLIIAKIKYQTANDLVVYNNIKLIRWFLSGYMHYAFQLTVEKKKVPYKKNALLLICRYFSNYRGLLFLIALLTAFCFKKGYNLMKLART